MTSYAYQVQKVAVPALGEGGVYFTEAFKAGITQSIPSHLSHIKVV